MTREPLKPDLYVDPVKDIFRNTAGKLGFSACRFSRIRRLTEDHERLESYVSNGYQGNMAYLAHDPLRRADPALDFPEAKTVISLALYYNPPTEMLPTEPYRIARYALGKDYHLFIKSLLQQLVDEISKTAGDFRYRICCDSEPLLEKAWAVESGMGWIGRNTLLQVKDQGSWFLLGEILTDLELEPDPAEEQPSCGSCTRCLDACPTQALVAPYQLDARKCISYLSSVLKTDLGDKDDLHGWIYGCDICQEVCPYNRHAVPTHQSLLRPNPEYSRIQPADWKELNSQRFEELFLDSAIGVKGYPRLVRNLLHQKKIEKP